MTCRNPLFQRPVAEHRRLRRVGPSHLFSISFRQGSNYLIGVAGAGVLSSLLKAHIMELVLIGLAALLTSGLTLFSGFGLGTILMPVFALFFPLPLAIAATAVVHFANNLFRFGLMARQADWSIVATFSMPAAITAILGAASLTLFDRLPALWQYSFADSAFEITPVKAVTGILVTPVTSTSTRVTAHGRKAWPSSALRQKVQAREARTPWERQRALGDSRG